MTPWPGGFLAGAKGALRLIEAVPVEGSGVPGRVLSVRPLVVACGSGALQIDRAQAPGRNPVSGAELVNGLRLTVGSPLWA